MARKAESRRAALGRWLNGVWYGDRAAPAWLRAGERLYRAATARRVKRVAGHPPVPVIVVGNLVAGGTGKTPVVIALARTLTGAGWRVAIISRGYGGRPGSEPLLVDADTPVEQAGDEALEMARATGAPVWVARRRAKALEAARAAGAQVVISDDGLQHAALPRSLEICVVDGRRGFGNGRLLPAGPLRQPVTRLDQVDMVLVKQTSAADTCDETLRRADAHPFRIESGRLMPLPRSAEIAPPPPAQLDAVAGIADPEPFFEHLEALGYRLRRHALLDHQSIHPDWLASLPGPVVMTVKDAMRLGAEDVREDLFTVPVRAVLPAEVLARVLAHVREFRA